jgi:hypothetical protein
MKRIPSCIFIFHFIFLFSGCSKKNDVTRINDMTRIIITGIDDFVSINENVQLEAKGISGSDTLEISGAEWITNNDGRYILNNNILTAVKSGRTVVICKFETFTSNKYFEIVDSTEVIIRHEFRIGNLDPPSNNYNITGGNCGEAVLWTICHYFGNNLSQQQINYIGGDPGRGLYGNEVINVLDSLKIPFNFRDKADTWENTVDTLRNIIIKGNPVILGVKIYPDLHPEWYCDHFILLTGTDTLSKEFYYNSNNFSDSISYAKLCNTNLGYSLVNILNGLYALEILITK